MLAVVSDGAQRLMLRAMCSSMRVEYFPEEVTDSDQAFAERWDVDEMSMESGVSDPVSSLAGQNLVFSEAADVAEPANVSSNTDASAAAGASGSLSPRLPPGLPPPPHAPQEAHHSASSGRAPGAGPGSRGIANIDQRRACLVSPSLA